MPTLHPSEPLAILTHTGAFQCIVIITSVGEYCQWLQSGYPGDVLLLYFFLANLENPTKIIIQYLN